MKQSLYAQAQVGRAGLGNLLLIWARCEIFRHLHKIPMLAPQWTAPKIGPLLRGEKDLRYYTGLFKSDDYVHGLRKLVVLATARKLSEAQLTSQPDLLSQTNGRRVVVFSGLGKMFEPLLPHKALVRDRLMTILSDRIRQRLAEQTSDFVIGVHLRRGDKPPLEFGKPQSQGAFNGMPDQWFVRCIENVRTVIGKDAPVRVFSDARPAELQAVLSMPHVSLAPANPSIIDLLMLANSQILIGTALSTFSQWASFLGEMPSLWYPAGAIALNPDKPNFESETDLAGNLSSAFLDLLESKSSTVTLPGNTQRDY